MAFIWQEQLGRVKITLFFLSDAAPILPIVSSHNGAPSSRRKSVAECSTPLNLPYNLTRISPGSRLLL